MFQLSFPIFIEGHPGSDFYLIRINLTPYFHLCLGERGQRVGVTIVNIGGNG